MKLSVIICTYNPDPGIFQKCLDALGKAVAVYPPEEILIIDNNSDSPLAQTACLQDFSNRFSQVRVVPEKTPGLTPARLRGIKEAKGDLLVFIDDDNLVAADFLLKGKEVSEKNPFMGAWSGQVKLQFESKPPGWTKQYWGLLVSREFEGEHWSNFPHLPDSMPCGAGLYVRKKVAVYYYQLHESGKRKVQLDRSGKSLFSGGDNDLAACACDIGLGVGLFSSLFLEHYIPASRLTREYLLRLAEGIAASSIVFKTFRGEIPVPLGIKNKLANTMRMVLKSPVERQFYRAVLRGEETGRRVVEQNR